ncbi:MAG: hypothetical protein QOF76_128, partial [Solirubrobacteraceae bacterium]|nr:hypothetical protein [Solirubrobacteraceae bacterium]
QRCQGKRRVSRAGLVTFLFTDLVGSTEQLEELGDDEAEAIRRAHFRLLRDAVRSRGGEEVKNLGDGLMVAFVSAVEAVGCAIAIQQAVHRHNERDGAHPVSVRVGLNVGEPVRDDDDYFGTPVVVAKRLCDAAEGDQIVASDLVERLVGSRGGFAFRSLGELQLKGMSRPVSASEVAWVPESTQPTGLPGTLAAAGRTAFVGRGAELERLQSAWVRARDGDRRLVVIAGEPGIGKTRLASQFCSMVAAEGAMVLLGRCYEETLAPYQPFVEALSQYVRAVPAETLRFEMDALGALAGELARLVPEIAERLPALPSPRANDPDGERYRLFEAVAGLAAEATTTRPGVIVLDDVQWADKPTLLLLRHVMRSTTPNRLLIVLTYREGEAETEAALAETLADLHRDHLVERISLSGLGESDGAALLAALTGEGAPAEFGRAVWTETEGNPFFIEELGRHLIETGAVQVAEGRWASDLSVAQIGIPEGVQHLIRRRLSLMRETTRQTLISAAVLGREFDVAALEALGDRSELELVEALEEALDARLVREASQAGRYRFSHALVRETLYQEQSALRRQAHHRNAAQALEQLYAGSLDAHAAELAHHLLEAGPRGDPRKAAEYAARAGNRAVSQLAFEDAVAHFERALAAVELCHPPDERLRLELLLMLARAQRKTSELDRARDTFWRAADAARALEAWEDLAHAALGVGEYRPATHPIKGHVDLLEEALARLGESHPALRAWIAAALSGALIWTDQWERSQTLAREALELGRRTGDRQMLPYTLMHYQWATWTPDNTEERLALCDEMVALSVAVGNTLAATQGRAVRACCLLERGDVDGAEAVADELVAAVVESAIPDAMYQASCIRSNLACLRGDFDDAERHAQDAFAAMPNAMVRLMGLGVTMYSIRRGQGRLGEVVAIVEQTVAGSPHLVGYRAVLAHVYAVAGREDDARRELTAHDDVEHLRRDIQWPIVVTSLAEVYALLGEADRAARLYPLLEPFERRSVSASQVICMGSFARPLGQLAATFGDHARAAAHFELALEVNRRMRAAPWVADTQYWYARTLLAQGDRDRASAQVTEALEIAGSLGMARKLEQLREIQADLAATEPVLTTPAPGLEPGTA